MDIKHFSEGNDFHFSSSDSYTTEETFISNSFNSHKSKKIHERSIASEEKKNRLSKNLNIEKITSNIKNIYI